MEIAKVLEYGGRKYDDNNWCKGANWSRYLGALQRHILAWAGDEDLDQDTKINHLAHAGCNLLFLLQYQLSGIGTDDRIGHAIENHRGVGAKEEGPDGSL